MEELNYMKFLEWVKEDIPYWDYTTKTLIPEDVEAVAEVKAGEECIVAYVEEVASVLEKLGLKVNFMRRSGEKVAAGEVILEVKGKASKILEVERTILNVLGRASGVATETWKYVEKAKKINPRVRIAATRKTTPGLRSLEKKAVLVGGGDTHRLSLSDTILIKDNHLKLIGSIEEAVEKAKRLSSFTKKVEVEVENVEDALKAARAGADIIMLDNMMPDQVREVIGKLEAEGLREKVIIEVSGGINEENISEYAKLDVDVISIGRITRNARIVDFNLDICRVDN